MTIALLRPQPLSNRLWQAGGILAAVVLTIVVANQFLPAARSVGGEMLGHDFLAFYTAGTLARDGGHTQLYNLDHSNQFQHTIGREYDLELGTSFGPYWNPPVYAWTFAPLAALPYPYALTAWIGVNLLCAVVAIALLARMVAEAAHPWPVYESQSLRGFVQPWRYWLLVPVLICLSMPFIQSLSHGQNSMMSLLLLTLTVVCWRRRKALLAGMVCGLLFYKPQLAAVVAVMLTLTMGWRALAGIVFVGLNLLALQEMTMPGSTAAYFHQLPLNLAVLQIDGAYLWERHVTLKAFWRLLFQGREPGETSPAALVGWAATSAVLFLGLIVAYLNTRKTRLDDAFSGHTRAVQRDRLIAATIASMPLLMPFYFDYDLLLLAIPLTLLAVEQLRRNDEQKHTHDSLLVKVACGLYLWLMVNPGMARDGGVNVTVVLLAAIAGLLIARASRESVSTVQGSECEQPQVAPRPIFVQAGRRAA